MDNYGIIVLLPPLVIILLALWTKRTAEPLFIGACIAFAIAHGWGWFTPWLDGIYAVMGDSGTIWVLLACGLFGSLIALLEKSNGAQAFSKLMLHFCKSQRSTMIATWILGIVIFVDDYLNAMTLGASMRRVSDHHKIPREMLSYLIDSTAAPICVILPFSTWVVFYGGVFAKQAELWISGSGVGFYYSIIPYIFYGWAAVIVVPLVIFGIIPVFGPMKKAYQRVAKGGEVFSEDSRKFNLGQDDDNSERSGLAASEKLQLANFFVPILLLIGVTIWTQDLLIGIFVALLTCMVMYLTTKSISIDDFSDSLLGGFGKMVPILAIIIGAFLFQKAGEEIGMANYIVESVKPIMSAALLPAVTFIVVACLSFITGSSWGIPAICVPIIAPLALTVGAAMPLSMAAIVAGGTFGSHACFYSDATVLSAAASRIETMEHALTQLPFALIAAIAAFLMFLVFGFIMA